MRNRLRSVMMTVATVAAIAALLLGAAPDAGQVPATGQFPPYRAPRTADGHPDLNGIWQALTTANWDIQDHEARPGLHPELEGTYDAQHPGQGIVEGGPIPYQPSVAAKKKANFEKRMIVDVSDDTTRYDAGDPELKCYRAGVPRATYMPFPFQIFQTHEQIMIVYEYKSTVRTIYMDPHRQASAESWMGWSNGHWEGDTLVVDVTDFNDQTWFDRAGDFHSDALHVIERYTPISSYHVMYEATIEDPKVFTRPWKMSFPLYRRVEKNVQLVDFNCVPFVEELMYGHLRK